MNKAVADYILGRSVNELDSIEITAVVGCARKCTYCPQDLIIDKYRLIRGEDAQLLHPRDFEKMLQNLPDKLIVYWTGFAEPLQNKHFPELFRMVSERGYTSYISTTLFTTNQDSIKVICDRDKWGRIGLHLPDNSGYMQGKVDKQYLDNLREVVLSMDPARQDMFHVFGELHDGIKALFQEPEVRDKAARIPLTEIPLDSPLATTRANNATDHKGSVSVEAPAGTLLYCHAKRFNQPVLLPNGDLSMCCMDYGLTGIIGNLLHEPYDSIVQRASRYMSHNLPPLCFNCEWATRFQVTE